MYRKLLTFFLSLIILISLNRTGYTESYIPKPGETLEYKVIVKSVIHGANQTIRILGKERYQNREVYRIQLQMYTVGVVRSISDFSETEELLLDAEGLYPHYLKRKETNGEKSTVEEVVFDYRRQIAIRTHSKNGGPLNRSEIRLPGYVQDGLSLLFYLRKGSFKDGLNQLNFYSNGSIEQVEYEVKTGKGELKLDCGIFPQYYQVDNKKIAISVLVSNNGERYPLIIRKLANFGKVEARLVRAK